MLDCFFRFHGMRPRNDAKRLLTRNSQLTTDSKLSTFLMSVKYQRMMRDLNT